jgi:hypothetical protein
MHRKVHIPLWWKGSSGRGGVRGLGSLEIRQVWVWKRKEILTRQTSNTQYNVLCKTVKG